MIDKETPYRIGNIVQGKITGIKPYGVFVKLDENYQGLIHISEANHGFVEDLNETFKMGEEIIVKIIDIDEYTHQLSLSVRALKPLPVPDHPSKRHRPRRRQTPKIGFQSIEENMPGWIDEGLKNIRVRVERDGNNESY